MPNIDTSKHTLAHVIRHSANCTGMITTAIDPFLKEGQFFMALGHESYTIGNIPCPRPLGGMK